MSDTFTELCNLDTIFSTTRNWDNKPNIVYASGNVYGGYSTTGLLPSLMYRFNVNDPSGNKATLTNTKFNGIKAIVVDATNVYCFSSDTPTKIYSIPLLFNASSPITDIDLLGVSIPSVSSAFYYMIKTSTDFYITYSQFVYRINNNTVYNFSTLPNGVDSFDINTNTGKLYVLNSTNVIYSIDPSGVAVGSTVAAVNTGATIPTNTLRSTQMVIYDNKLYLQYKTSTSYYLGINTIGDISFNSVVMNDSAGNVFSGNSASNITINTDNNKLYFRQAASDIIYTSAASTYCFNKGTKILCMNNQLEDEYINIELLQIGDFVKTYKHGYRKVSKVITGIVINNPKKWNMCMYKMVKTESNGLLEDLIVTGGHSLLVDAISDEEQKKYDEMDLTEFSKTTIDNKRLLLSCVSDQFTPMQDTDIYTYYHLLLENNNDDEERFGIWANGILTETPNEKTIK
jgi:hypothetical protein